MMSNALSQVEHVDFWRVHPYVHDAPVCAILGSALAVWQRYAHQIGLHAHQAVKDQYSIQHHAKQILEQLKAST